MKLTKLLVVCLLVMSCSDDDFSIDQTQPSFTITPIAMDQVSSFIAFGESLTPTQQNPAIEYFTSQSNIQVRSVSDGVVEDIRLNINIDDFEVWIKPNNNSRWLIIYDHVLDINISIGDQVNAGQTIGIIGIGNRTELQVNDVQNVAHCPLQFGTQSFVQQHINFSEDWCIAETVIP
ncbi:peptidoglycan DD-metalloendopeptidase family protein [uncultured Aquimarina sp.]|uniref:peptidoglycan DD-metalloendopeptidase family protein n=1 Tax=uncultured Aquimarina sp. TaxID=575652 RepID=UPI00262609BE|nr:peptidoglycan DD-metalloendopeptidase family protein [uncultured Aquimarina sp.]